MKPDITHGLCMVTERHGYWPADSTWYPSTASALRHLDPFQTRAHYTLAAVGRHIASPICARTMGGAL